MSYTPFDARVFPIFIYYIILVIFSVFLTVKMFLKWRERKVPPPLYLTIVFTLLTAAIVVLTIGMAEAILLGEYREIYRFSLPFAYSMIVLADIFLYKFASFITEKGEKILIPLLLVGILIIIVLFLPWNWWGTPQEDYAGELNIRIYSTLGLIAFSYLIYIAIALICIKSIKQTQDKVAKFGLKLLFLSMICMILFFVMMIMDTLLIQFYNHDGYSEFVYIAWLFAIIFYILMYFSLIMPEGLVKRLTKE